jgi:hypothetical protein
MHKAFAVLIWITVTGLAYGQLPSSTMNGRVTDLQGARVVSARVTITNNARGSSRETLTNAEGIYVFPSLEVGTYDLKVESPSFAVTETHSITLEVGRIQTIDVSLHPASANAVVNVSEAEAATSPWMAETTTTKSSAVCSPTSRQTPSRSSKSPRQDSLRGRSLRQQHRQHRDQDRNQQLPRLTILL